MHGFNSLQTGKCIQRPYRKTTHESVGEFQFPSNGKVYPKEHLGSTVVNRKPSFQFPSNGKVYPKPPNRKKKRWKQRFQFPSNGKVYPKTQRFSERNASSTVSIPFKRESVSKVSYGCGTSCETKFQFPSNGKVYPKLSAKTQPFLNPGHSCFNSLQTGKCIQSNKQYTTSC